ncbi:salicylaldehyde dehydrogenase [Aureobasidium pullulans]|nr:salicylaldehyde dehydrogenase [Aureobasidium pullulans]
MTPMATGNESEGRNVPLHIDGEEITTGQLHPVTNPTTDAKIWHISSASVQDAKKAIEAAQNAFPGWASTKPHARRDIFLRAAQIFETRAEQLRHYMKEETGAEAKFVEFNIQATISQIKDLAGRISGIQGSLPTVDAEGRSAMVLKEPYGVVFGIAPWNAPYILGCRAFSYALAAGNTVVLKGSELSPKCFHALVDIFYQAGLPRGCLNLLFVAPKDAAEVTTSIIAHPKVLKINFTGSGRVGSIIAATAGKYLKPVLMELGGKATAIVLEDADIEKAALGCALGAFLHSGQVCMATERIAVHRSIEDNFIEAFKATIDAVFPPSLPAMTLINPQSASKVRGLIDNAVENGAAHIHGPTAQDASAPSTSLRPVVLGKVDPKMDLHYEESFGPVVSLYSFDTLEEALVLANDTEYGLAGAVFTENLGTGLKVAKAYATGAVHINSMSIHDEPSLPHGGVKQSGFGRFNGNQGLEEFLRTKVVTWED